jgi:fumarylacetoacetase
MKSWLNYFNDSDFSIYNIPFGIIQQKDGTIAASSRIGDNVIDLYTLAKDGFLDEFDFDKSILCEKTLNRFIALGKPVTSAIRKKIQFLFSIENEISKDKLTKYLLPVDEVKNLLPVHIPNYTDFYSSREHATNVGAMFRDPPNALLPNWLHLPVGYHGRASSIVVSGTPLHRPKGQTKADDQLMPSFGPCRLLDFELEVGFIVGKETALGDSVSTADAEDYIFGLVLFNDWSARDIQKWEYVPLGPFLAKNFGSSVSPWIVTLDALEPFRTDSPQQEPTPLSYLQFAGKKNYDLNLTVDIVAENGSAKTVSKSNFKHMYWNMCQQLAHHTVNGCNIEVGDLYASGTISGSTPDSYGSMLEITWGGKNPIQMPDGTERKFILDGDTVSIKGFCEKENVKVGFGEVFNKILPAK